MTLAERSSAQGNVMMGWSSFAGCSLYLYSLSPRADFRCTLLSYSPCLADYGYSTNKCNLRLLALLIGSLRYLLSHVSPKDNSVLFYRMTYSLSLPGSTSAPRRALGDCVQFRSARSLQAQLPQRLSDRAQAHHRLWRRRSSQPRPPLHKDILEALKQDPRKSSALTLDFEEC